MSGLPPAFWVDAVLHAVYLYNRTVHRAINMTPHEAHLGVKSDLSRLRTFGSRVLCKVPGKQAGKIDHHVYKGIFIGYGATDKHIRYVDSITSQEKVVTHVVFDKAHYTATTRSPGPQLLYSLGLPQDDKDEVQSSKDTASTKAVYPTIPSRTHKRQSLPTRQPLPLQEYSAPWRITARAAKIDYLWE